MATAGVGEGPVTPDEIQSWLGLAPGEVLTVTPPLVPRRSGDWVFQELPSELAVASQLVPDHSDYRS